MDNEVNYKNISTMQLVDILENSLSDYMNQVELKDNIYEELLLIVTNRDEIHDILLELSLREHSVDTNKLRKTDKDWQQWLKEEKGLNFQYNDHTKPMNKWWWWINELDELTDEQLKAL